MNTHQRFRFAPTPSRPLHIGSALAAVLGWGYARTCGGAFVLRIEDIDQSRCRPEHEAQAISDLHWLGLDWDEGPDVGGPHGSYRQSGRMKRYDAAIHRLLNTGQAYVCTCSRSEIRAVLADQRAPHTEPNALYNSEPPYPGTCRDEGHKFRADRGGARLDAVELGVKARVTWADGGVGPMVDDVRAHGGDVLLGRPGRPSYQLAVVVDDGAMAITDVVRGRDLLGSTARQILLHRALDQKVPAFHHHPLIVDETGRKLSKREAATPLRDVRANGGTADRLIARVGQAVGLFDASIRSASIHDVVEALAAGPTLHNGQLAAVAESVK
ncbi:MAG: glutamyl-tRNA synthetase [Myxococcota bacterium]|jgi:glutamyl-tRNA synthetase